MVRTVSICVPKTVKICDAMLLTDTVSRVSVATRESVVNEVREITQFTVLLFNLQMIKLRNSTCNFLKNLISHVVCNS